jgi:hypothetical protein
MPTFGPGTLTIGATGAEIDVSCLVNSMRITSSKDEGDSTTKLCGTVKPGKVTYTYSLTGNIDIDSDTPDGLFALSQAEPGTEQPFEFTPNTEGETSAAGTLIIDPLDFGADEFGDDMTSDLEFSLVGAPVYTYPVTPLASSAGYKPIVVNGRTGAGQKVTPTSPDVGDEPAKKKAKAEAAA